MNPSPLKRIVVGITGASGAAYAVRTLQLLVAAHVETHAILSPLGQRLLHDELDLKTPTPETLLNCDAQGTRSLGSSSNDAQGTRSLGWSQGDPDPSLLTLHPYRDVGDRLASGSFRHDGMIVVPCSSNTLSAIATGRADHLIHRAAHVTLKERRRLILVHRESPLSLIDIRNMEAATLAGAIIAPATPGFYMRPRSVADLVDFVAGRALDLLDIPHPLPIRWSGKATNTP